MTCNHNRSCRRHTRHASASSGYRGAASLLLDDPNGSSKARAFATRRRGTFRHVRSATFGGGMKPGNSSSTAAANAPMSCSGRDYPSGTATSVHKVPLQVSPVPSRGMRSDRSSRRSALSSAASSDLPGIEGHFGIGPSDTNDIASLGSSCSTNGNGVPLNEP
jgi:hypothetical protein